MTDKPRVRVLSNGIALTDGLTNVVANLGTARDKAAHTRYAGSTLDDGQLMAMYESSWLAAATVDYPVEDATRKWRRWRARAEQITAIEDLETRLQVKVRIQEALKASRLLGGAAIYINAAHQEPAEPLRVGGEIRSLVVLPRNQIDSGEVVRDINSEYYGRPEFYTILSGERGNQIKIHASRFVILPGVKVPGSMLGSVNRAWGSSVLQRTEAAIKSADSTIANIASLVFEANVDVMRVQGFATMLERDQDSLILRRAHLQAAMKGINGMLMIDAQDSYDKKAAQFSGLDSLLGRFFDWAAGATGIPVTRLFGRAAAGLSGSGDGDERVYYDRIEDIQAQEIGPAMRLLDECLIYQALGSRPPEVYYEWSTLRQKTESENADLFTKYAQAARALAGTNAGEVVPLDALSDAMVNALTESGALPGLEGYIKEYGTMAQQNGFVGGAEDEV